MSNFVGGGSFNGKAAIDVMEQDWGFSVTESDETWVVTSNGFTGV